MAHEHTINAVKQDSTLSKLLLLLLISSLAFLSLFYSDSVDAKVNNKKEIKIMKKAQIKVKNLSRAVESLEKFKNKDTNGFQRRLSGMNKQIDKKVDEIMGLTADLSGSNASIINDDVSDIQHRLAVLNGSVEKEAGDKEASKDLWKNHIDSQEYKSDKAKLAVISQLETHALDIKGRRFRAGTDSQIEDSLSLVKSLPSMSNDLADMEKNYQQYGKHARFIISDINSAREKAKALQEQLDTSKAIGDDVLKEKDKLLRIEVENVFIRKEQVESGGGTFSLDYALIDKSQPVSEVLLSIKRIALFLEAARGNTGSAKNISDASYGYYDGVVDEMSDAIAASKTTPENTYAGGDRKSLEAFVMKNHHKGKDIVGVYLRGNWYQEKKQTWVASNSAFEETNRSSLEGMVLIKLDSEWALESWIRLVKDHTQSDKLILKRDMQPNPNPRPSEKIKLNKI